jgi:hypothetical protein
MLVIEILIMSYALKKCNRRQAMRNQWGVKHRYSIWIYAVHQLHTFSKLYSDSFYCTMYPNYINLYQIECGSYYHLQYNDHWLQWHLSDEGLNGSYIKLIYNYRYFIYNIYELSLFNFGADIKLPWYKVYQWLCKFASNFWL